MHTCYPDKSLKTKQIIGYLTHVQPSGIRNHKFYVFPVSGALHTRSFISPFVRLFGIILILCVLSFGLHHITLSGSTDTPKQNRIEKELSFRSITVNPNDTLWSIAKENYSEEYGSLKNYIKEIKRCNSLTTDHINAGSSLLVPIYVSVDSGNF